MSKDRGTPARKKDKVVNTALEFLGHRPPEAVRRKQERNRINRQYDAECDQERLAKDEEDRRKREEYREAHSD